MNSTIIKNAVEKINGTPVKLGKTVYSSFSDDLEIKEWESLDKEYWGYVRDDAGGISVVTCFESYDDECMVASWNLDFDIKKYLTSIPKKAMRVLLEIAAQNGWRC